MPYTWKIKQNKITENNLQLTKIIRKYKLHKIRRSKLLFWIFVIIHGILLSLYALTGFRLHEIWIKANEDKGMTSIIFSIIYTIIRDIIGAFKIIFIFPFVKKFVKILKVHNYEFFENEKEIGKREILLFLLIHIINVFYFVINTSADFYFLQKNSKILLMKFEYIVIYIFTTLAFQSIIVYVSIFYLVSLCLKHNYEISPLKKQLKFLIEDQKSEAKIKINNKEIPVYNQIEDVSFVGSLRTNHQMIRSSPIKIETLYHLEIIIIKFSRLVVLQYQLNNLFYIPISLVIFISIIEICDKLFNYTLPLKLDFISLGVSFIAIIFILVIVICCQTANMVQDKVCSQTKTLQFYN